MARARFPGKSSQQNGSRKRLWLPEDQFEECSYVTRNEASVAIRSTKNFDVLFSGSSKNPESLRRLSSCLGESVYAVSKRLRAFSAPPCEPQGNDSGGRSSSSSGGGASARSSPAAGSGRAARRNGRTPSAEPAAAAPALESFSGGRGRTRADSARVGAQSPAAEEAGRRGRSRSQSQSGSPAHRAAGAAAAEPGPVRTRRAAAAAETPPPVGGPPETAGRSTRSTSQPTSAAGPAPTAAAGPGPGLVVTRSSRVVRPARRFLDESSSSSSASPAPPPPPPVGEASSRPSRPARALSPSSDVELDEGVIKTVVEYADSMAAAPGRAAAAPAAVEPAPVSQPAQADIEAMLRSQWDGRLKVRGREEEAAAVPGRHLLRQPRLHLNNRVLKRLRDGRDLTYLSEQDEAPQLEPEPAGAPGAGNGAPSAGSGPGGHVTCGTCGSRRFVAVPDLCYKFGSWICMHCIKFVLTTLKQTSLAPKCIDNKELCRTHADPSEPELAPPEQRCEACWLQACLNALNFSEERHNRLRSSLPRSHQAAVPLFSRKRRQETGGCQFGPSPPPPAAVPALPAPPPTRCPNKAWGGGDARDSVGFETLSRPAAGDSKEPAQEPAGSQPPAADGNTGSEANSAPDKPANNRTEDTDGDGSNDKMHNASEKGILKENSTSVAPPGTEALSNEESKSAEPTVTEGGAKDEPTAAAPTRVETRSKDDLKPATPARTETGSKDEPKPEVLTRPETRSKEEWRAAAPARPGTRSRTDRWPPPPPGVHSRKAVTVVPLGGGWKRREFVRKGGRLDLIVYSPDGTRFKSVVELQAYLRGMDITRKAQSFFTDGVPPSGGGSPPAEPGQQEPVIRDSFVKRGPRVKVVCRSASLVLGQPRATFGGGSPPAPTLSPQPPALSPRSPSPGGKENRAAGRLDGWPPGRRQAVGVRKLKKRRHVAGDDKSSSRNVLMKLKVLHKYKHLQQSRGNKERIRKSRCGVCLGCKAKNCTKCVFCSDMIKYGGPGKLKKSCIARVCKRPLLPGVNSLKLLPPPAAAGDRSERSPELAPPTGSPARPADRGATAAAPAVQPGRRSSPLVRLDHWSPLEPTELWERGLAVLAAQPPGVPVLCFVCASAGQEEMLYCNSCCEPYHPFCLEEVEVPLSALHQENWVCARCQVCCVCGAAPPGQPLHRCHQCSETYHLACLGPHGCAPPGRSDQPWMLGWPFAPAGPHAEPAGAAACSPPPPADRLTPLACLSCYDLPKVEDPAADRRSPIAWGRPASPPLRFDLEELLGGAPGGPGPAAACPESDAETDCGSDVSAVEEPSFAGFSRRSVFGGAPDDESDAAHESDHDERDDALLAMLTRVEDGDETDAEDQRPVEHRKRKKRRKRKRLGRPPKKCRWKEVSAQRRAEAAAARAAPTPSPEKAVRLVPRARPRSPPLPTVYTIPLQYELLDQAAALELLFAGMNGPCMTGSELERIGLQLPETVEYREQGDAGSSDDSSEADEPLSVVDFLRETVDAELDALGYPPAAVPFVLGAGRPRRRRRRPPLSEPTSAATPARRPPVPGSQWARSRLPPGMSEIEWERWRRLLPPRKGRPRKFPRPDDLLLIEQLRQNDPALRLHGPPPFVGEGVDSYLYDEDEPGTTPAGGRPSSSTSEEEEDPAAADSEGPPELEREQEAAEPADRTPAPARPARRGSRHGVSAPGLYKRHYVTSRAGTADGPSYRQLLGLRGARRPAASRLLQAGRRALKAARRRTALSRPAGRSPSKGPGSAQSSPRKGDSAASPARPGRRPERGPDGASSAEECSDGGPGERLADGDRPGSPLDWCDALIEAVSDVSGEAEDALLAPEQGEQSDPEVGPLRPDQEDALLADDGPPPADDSGDAFLLAQYVDVQEPARPSSPDKSVARAAARRQDASADPYAKTYSTGAGRRRRPRGDS